MKYDAKCPVCKRKATKRMGKIKLCESCAKQVKRQKKRYVLTDKLIFTIDRGVGVYRDYAVSIY